MAEFNDENGRLIFIGGSPRSGTTLVQNMLDSHPLVLGGPEFLHLPDMIGLRRKLYASIALEWIDIFCSREDVDNHLVKTIKKLFLPLAEKYQCEFYSEKTPENILVFSELIDLFPEAHFIQIVRDPRAILSSMQQVKKRAIDKGLKAPSFTVNTSTSIAYIKRCFDAGLKATRHAPEKVLTVVYEQLVADPEMETNKICRHLGIDWDERMLRPGEKKHLGAKAITVNSNEIWYDPKTYNRNVTSRDSEKWRRELSIYQQLHATMVFSGQESFTQHGYDYSLSGLTHDLRVSLKALIYCLYFVRTAFRSILFVIRKIPGISIIKKGLRRVVNFS